MALLFSAVTVTAGYDEAEFTVGGIPREYDDLVAGQPLMTLWKMSMRKQRSAYTPKPICTAAKKP